MFCKKQLVHALARLQQNTFCEMYARVHVQDGLLNLAVDENNLILARK